MKGWHHDLHGIFFLNNIMAIIKLFVLTWKQIEKEKKNANSIILLFKKRKVPIKKPNFPMRKVSLIVEILVWQKTSKEGRTYMVDLNKIALSFGDTYIESFLQLAIITSSK